jgi:hypothetical protein
MRVMLGPVGARGAGGESAGMVRELKEKGFGITVFQPDLSNLDPSTAHAVAALAREGMAVKGPDGSLCGKWKPV